MDEAAAIAGADEVETASAVVSGRRWPGAFMGRTAFWISLINVVLIVLFGAFNRNFLGIANFQNLAIDGSETVLLATAEAFLLAAGEFDISLGANLVLASVVGSVVMTGVAGTSAQVQNNVYPHLAVALPLGYLLCLLTGAAVGLLNGLMVTRLRINSLIATLAMLGIASGVADVITGGSNVPYVPPVVQSGFGIRNLGFVPLPALVVLAVLVGAWLALTKTRFGLYTVALGSSREAALRAGLPVEQQLLALFALAGLLAGLAGLIDLSRFATTDLAGHETDALAAIAGAVIGGTPLQGGRASVGGAIAGALIAVILQAGLVMIGLSPFYQLIAVGLVLVAAVHLDQRRSREP
jgi:ribose transport system permease protein